MINICALLLIPAMPIFAAEAAPLREHCFCIKHSRNSLPPYFLGRLDTPECKDAKFRSNGRTVYESGIPRCEELRKCVKPTAEQSRKKKTLSDKIAEANKGMEACCPHGDREPCDAGCISKWEAALKYLEEAQAKMDAEIAALKETCLSKIRAPRKAKTK